MDCPSEDDVLALVEGKMGEITPSLEAHLDGCATCRALVVAAASFDAEIETDANGAVADERYDVRGEVGRGGQSRVLRAYDRRMGREVALKVFTERGEGSSGGPSAADRCIREVRTTGALNHPAILPVHELGVRPGGASYYTMPLVDGRTLTSVVLDTTGTASRIRLLPHVVQICQAVAYAHSRGFLHRDIKPENVMVGAFGETLLLDWGLARIPSGPELEPLPDDAAEHDETLDGSVLGTPAYMSPEQAAGRLQELGPASDVWSLGALLYFVLSGHAPFRNSPTALLLDRVRKGDLEPLRASDGDVPPELAAIVARAMSLDPQHRYTASGLADDLIAFQSSDRVSAYPYAAWEMALRFAKRYRTFIAATGLVVVSLLAGLFVATTSYRRAVAAKLRTEQALAEAAVSRSEAELSAASERQQALEASRNLALAHVEKSEQLRSERRPLESRLFATSALRHTPSHTGRSGPDGSDAETTARALGQLALGQLDEVERVTRQADRLGSGSLHEIDGGDSRCRWVAVADGQDTVQVFSDREHELAATLPGHQDGAVEVALSPQGHYAVTRDGGGRVRRWALPAGRLEGHWSGGNRGLLSIAVADSGAVAFVDEEGRIRRVRGSSEVAERLPKDTHGASSLGFSADSTRLAAGVEGGSVLLYDAETGALLEQDSTLSAPVTDLAWSVDGAFFVVAASDGRVRVLDADTLQLRVQFSGHAGFVSSIAISEDGRRLYTAAADGKVRGFDLGTRRRTFAVQAPAGHPYEIQIDGDDLRTWGARETRTWRLRAPKPGIRKSPEARNAAAIHQDGTSWMPKTADPGLVWVDWANASSGEVQFEGASPVSRVAAFGDRWATLHNDGSIAVWTAKDRAFTRTRQWTGGGTFSTALAASEATDTVATANELGAIQIWVTAEEVPQVLSGHERRVMSLAFSADGHHLLSGGYDGRVLEWDLRDPSADPKRLRDGGDSVYSIRWGPDGTRVAAGEFGVLRWAPDSAGPQSWSETPHRDVVIGAEHVAGLADDGTLSVWTRAGDLQLRLTTTGGRSAQGLELSVVGSLRIFGRSEAWQLPLDRTPLQSDPVKLLETAYRDAGVPSPGGTP